MKRKNLKNHKEIYEFIQNHNLLDSSERDILVFILERYRIGVINLSKMFYLSENFLRNRIDEYKLKYLLPNKEDIVKIQKESRKKTMLERYGVEHMSQIKSVRDSKRGDKNPSTWNDVKKKKISTTLRHYGVTNPFQSDVVKDMIKQTNLTSYGVENPSQISEIKEKKIKTTLKNYGVTSPIKALTIREKTKRTNLRVYGVE